MKKKIRVTKLAAWLAKPGHGAEIIHTRTGDFCVLLHDANGANAEGHGADPDAAAVKAQERYRADRHRASLTTERAATRRFTGQVWGEP